MRLPRKTPFASSLAMIMLSCGGDDKVVHTTPAMAGYFQGVESGSHPRAEPGAAAGSVTPQPTTKPGECDCERCQHPGRKALRKSAWRPIWGSEPHAVNFLDDCNRHDSLYMKLAYPVASWVVDFEWSGISESHKTAVKTCKRPIKIPRATPRPRNCASRIRCVVDYVKQKLAKTSWECLEYSFHLEELLEEIAIDASVNYGVCEPYRGNQDGHNWVTAHCTDPLPPGRLFTTIWQLDAYNDIYASYDHALDEFDGGP